MMQFIEFYITTYNKRTESVINGLLAKMQEYGDVKSWKTVEEESDSVHYTVLGGWAAYSTIGAISKKKAADGQDSILFSLEHFEED